MKKYSIASLLFLGLAAFCVSCGQQGVTPEMVLPSPVPEQSIAPLDTAEAVEVLLGERDALEIGETIPEEEPEEAEEETTEIPVVIYYGSKDFETLVYEEVSVSDPIPEVLIDQLKLHNIVSVDTKVLSFEEREAEDGTCEIVLDLSKGFGTYLSTMTEEGERILVAALTNTFLDTYDAQRLYLTAEGSTIVTLNHTYDEPLERSEVPANLEENGHL